MKKLLLIVSIILASYTFSTAQELGVRFGDVSGGSVAIDGVFSTGKFSRLHADISFGNGVGADLLWDFLYRPLGSEAFNWYVGVGPYLGVFDKDSDYEGNGGTDFNLGVVGEIGLEYRFNGLPISLSADYRPSLEIIDETKFHAGGFGLNIRYIFGY